MIKADFHVHTTSSDGLLSPSDIIKRAAVNNVKYLSITDHDNTSGLNEAVESAKQYNITFIPGVELSTQYNDESIHILGYFRDTSYNNPELVQELNKIKNHRIIRAQKIIEKLKTEYDISINYDDVKKLANGTVARPHIATAIRNAGHNYTHDEIFNNFIGKNCKAYVPTIKLSTENGINLLRKYNALVFLAHPKLIKKTHITELLKLKFDGIEAVYYQNSSEENEEYTKIAKDYNLLISCGSDFHGIPNDTRHGDVGSMVYSEDYLNSFLNALGI